MSTDALVDSLPPVSAQAVLEQALAWFDAGVGGALVTVMRTWSSASARPGSLLAVSTAGEAIGDVSGGAADAEVMAAAREAIEGGQPRDLRLQVSDAVAQQAGLPCGGSIELRIEPLLAALADTLRQVLQAVRTSRGVVLCTRLRDGHRLLIRTDGELAGTGLEVAAARAAAVDTTGLVDIDGDAVLLQVFNPPRRLFIVGAVHIAQALAVAAALVGFEVTVIDPRPSFATAARFPAVRCVVEPPELALRMATLDRRSAVVTLSHDPAIDDPAIVKALHSKAFYVGALGSRKTHKARLLRLQGELGVPERLTAKLQAPAGLAIGAIGPAEIAASIVAQLIAELRGRPQAREAGDAGTMPS